MTCVIHDFVNFAHLLNHKILELDEFSDKFYKKK